MPFARRVSSLQDLAAGAVSQGAQTSLNALGTLTLSPRHRSRDHLRSVPRSASKEKPDSSAQYASKLLLLSPWERCASFRCEKLTTQEAMFAWLRGTGSRRSIDFQL